MSSPYQILIRTDRQLQAVRAELTCALQATRARLDLGPADREDAQDAQQFFAIRPNFTGDLQPARAGQEGAMFTAALTWAQTAGAELVVLLDYEVVMAFREGTLMPASTERQFFEREVLPRWRGPVSWTGQSPFGRPL